MATSHTDENGPSRFNEPEPRRQACSTIVNNDLVMHRGWLPSYRGLKRFPPMPHVEVFSADLAKWTQRRTTGTLPPPQHGAVCTCINHLMYMFGGWTGRRYSNGLYELNTATLCWQEVHSTNPKEGPMPKKDCGMINTSTTRLCVIGGKGIPTSSLQPGSKFVLSKKYKDGRGSSNEIHSFDIPSGLWGVPPTTGQGPPPSDGFTFTRVDLVRAVFFGGRNAETRREVADVFLLTFETWHWNTLLPRGPSQPSPVGRMYHAAVSLYDPNTNPRPPHPCLAVAGGLAGDLTPLRDLWVLAIKDEHCWEEIPLPPSFTARWKHACGVINNNSTQATAVFFGGCPDNPSKYASAIDYPCMAQTTVVDLALEPSKAVPGKTTGWIATSCRDSTALAMQAMQAVQVLYNQALRHGFIESRSIVSVLTGVAGSGKTHVKYLLFQKKPPTVRISTPLLESPVRALSLTRVNTEDDEWHEVNDDEQLEMIAAALNTGDVPTKPASQSTSQETVQTQQPQSSDVSPTAEQPPTSQTTTPNNGNPPSKSLGQNAMFSPSTEHPQPPQSTTALASTSQPDQESDDSGIGEELIRLMLTASSSKKLLQADRIYLFDSGGQLVFHELLRHFLHRESVTIFVTKLNERLDHHPMIEYYGKGGKPLNRPHPSPLTHEDTLKYSFRAVQSQACIEGESEDIAPKLLVVGTHRDKERWCSESRKEKNEKLKALLVPAFQKMLLYYGEEMKELIFPVNAKNPSKGDYEVAKEIRKAILSAVSSLPCDKTPLGWHMLEIALRRLAASKRRSILHRQECLGVARKLHLSAEELDAAFDHLQKLNLIFYYRELLPQAVFTDPQLVMDKLNELVRYIYTLRRLPDKKIAARGDLLDFRDKGIITMKLLEEFPKHYESGLFSPSDLICILEHQLIIAHISGGKYFMPSLLLDLPAKQVEQYRVKPSSPAAPFAIHFPGGLAPCGLFCALVASLLSPANPLHWELLPSPTNRVSPECVVRNCIKFKLPDGRPGTVALIDSYSHFEVHVTAPGRVCCDLCPQIRTEMFRNLIAAAKAQRYSNLTPKSAFLCEFSEVHIDDIPLWRKLFAKATPPPHIANFSTQHGNWLTCSLTPEKAHGELQERHMIWLRAADTQVESLQLPKTNVSSTLPSDPAEALNTQSPGENLPPWPVHPSETTPYEANNYTEVSSTLSASAPNQNPPTLLELIRFRGRERRINIPQEIGVHYMTFGTLLLEDSNGARIRAMERKHVKDAEQINMEVFQEWVEGSGKQPVTWNTLVDVLCDTELTSLAIEIASVKAN